MDLMAILFGLMVLAMIALPALANTKPRADRLTCANNLRLIGRACHLWANDHRDLTPWRVNQSEGGTQQSSLQNRAWFNFVVMSNELVIPTIMACPADTGTRAARDFSSSTNGGFLSFNYRNNAVSYFIGLDSFLTSSTSLPGPNLSALGGDRNLRVDALQHFCSSGVTEAAAVWVGGTSVTQWTDAIHGTVGNILLIDGQVAQTSNARVRRTIVTSDADNGFFHLLLPR